MILIDKDFKKPCVLNIYKPKGVSSLHVVKQLKNKIGNKKLRIGHFGTLDSFAEGILLIGINGASRMNEYVHEYLPKTYLARGKLGTKMDTGDWTGQVTGTDTTDYLNTVIAKFDVEFLNAQFKAKFEGEYWQAPPAYSAAKYEGKRLHEWARDGVIIQKEKKLRQIYKVEVVKYDFPNLEIRFQVSSGTYIRTLFEDCAQHLGTLGYLQELVRENIGQINLDSTIDSKLIETPEFQLLDEKALDPLSVLPLSRIQLDAADTVNYGQGRTVLVKESTQHEKQRVWVTDSLGEVIGLAQLENSELRPLFNFPYAIDSIQHSALQRKLADSLKTVGSSAT
ncbi:MAG: tRNA pseudouridine(55) synthase TruB [Bacteriovoracaceae bacterium]|nr:tRNA pseudouridine(55) synthase TruB [Bacteriovoracaceae bacterium]